ncbi:MAG: GNAT family N-acetyltransferase [Chloroflexota bacterium]
MEGSTLFTVRDGKQIAIRAITPDDAPLLVDLFFHMSDTTRRLRFHSMRRNVSLAEIEREAQQLSDLDPAHQAALVATTKEQDTEQIVAVARLARAPNPEEAESAIVVRDDFQNQGLGSHMLKLLAETARSMNIKRLTAWVMAENVHMLHIIQKSGLDVHAETRYGETYISVPV